MKGEVKKAAKRGDQDVAKTLAREIVRSCKACNRLHVSKTQLNSVMMQMEQQLAQQKMLGTCWLKACSRSRRTSGSQSDHPQHCLGR